MSNTLRIGPYRVLRILGRGGMGAVYAARFEGTGGFQKDCALKVISLKSDRLRERFANEAVTGARLRHPNIVQTHRFGECPHPDDGSPAGYIEFDLVDGIDFKAVVKARKKARRPIPPSVAIELILPVCSALQYAWADARDSHGRPVRMIHRDIKPQNIMLGRFGEVKLLDFGVVRAETNPNPTFAPSVMGTIPYMSLEAMTGEPMDNRSDIFGVGAVLFELATGERLVDKSVKVMDRVDHTWVERRLKRLQDICPELAPALRIALAKFPKDRFYEHAAFKNALVEVQKTIGGSANLQAFARSLFPEDLETELYEPTHDRLAQARALLRQQDRARTEPLPSDFYSPAGESLDELSLSMEKAVDVETTSVDIAGPLSRDDETIALHTANIEPLTLDDSVSQETTLTEVRKIKDANVAPGVVSLMRGEEGPWSGKEES